MTDVQIIVLCAAGAQILFESYLRNANERRLLDMKDNPPASASVLMDEQTWGKATDYSIAKSRFSTVEDIFGFFLKRDGIEFSFTSGIFDVLKPLLAK